MAALAGWGRGKYHPGAWGGKIFPPPPQMLWVKQWKILNNEENKFMDGDTGRLRVYPCPCGQSVSGRAAWCRRGCPADGQARVPAVPKPRWGKNDWVSVKGTRNSRER